VRSLENPSAEYAPQKKRVKCAHDAVDADKQEHEEDASRTATTIKTSTPNKATPSPSRKQYPASRKAVKAAVILFPNGMR